MSEKKSIRVATAQDAEDAEFLVCALWQDHPFADDVRATCTRCGEDVGHRPHAPSRPARLCLHCFQTRLAEDSKVQIVTTQRMADDLFARGFRVTRD